MASLERIPLGQLEAVVLVSDELRASFVPAAGMIGNSFCHRGEELLVQRGGLDAWRGTGKSFGLPLLHPWANRLRDWRYAAAGRAVSIDRERGVVRADENGLPIHGALSAAEDWDVVDAGSDGAAAWLSASLDYSRRDDRLAVFPFLHRLELELRLEGDALAVTTTVEATGTNDVPLAFGWHPWLSLPGVPRAEWELALPPRTEFVLDRRNLPTRERNELGAECAPLAGRVIDAHFARRRGRALRALRRRPRDRGRVGGRLPLRPAVRARRARRRLPGADDGAGRRAVDGRGAAVRATRRAGERGLAAARHVMPPAG